MQRVLLDPAKELHKELHLKFYLQFYQDDIMTLIQK